MLKGNHNNSKKFPLFSVAVLAGGKSSRMGENKALEILGDKPLIAHVIDSLRLLTDDVFIVANDVAAYEGFGLPVCADHYCFRSSLVGIYSAIASSRHQLCLATACDMPFIEPALVRFMASLAPGYDAVVPVGPRGKEPLLAIYSKACLGAMRGHIEVGDLAIHHVLNDLNVRYVELAEMTAVCDPALVFVNVNNAAEFEEASKIILQTHKLCRQPHALIEEDSQIPLICFVGKKNSGKTTFLEKLVRELKSRGLTVAYVKHDVHGFEIDRKGTDTWRLAQAGAKSVTISSPFAIATMERVVEEKSLNELVGRIDATVDIVIGEGFKQARVDKIEISRSERSRSLVCLEDELLAVISDRKDAAARVPVFGLEDVAEVADFLVAHYGISITARQSE